MFRASVTDRLLLTIAKAHSRRVLKNFETAVRRAPAVQEHVLLQKIGRNVDSDYGRRFKFSSIRTYDDYRRAVPLQVYEEIVPYIERLKHGEHQALFGSGQRVLMFALTSGTSGQPKYVPVTSAFLNEFRAGWNAFGVKALLDHPGNFLTPIVQVTSRMDESLTPAGIPCGAITGLMAATQKFLVRKYYTTPLCSAHIGDPMARYYTIMRLAIPQRRIAFMVTANPATQLKLPKVADIYSEHIIRDIYDGTLSAAFDIPSKVRQQLSSRLTADAERAGELEQLVGFHGRLLPKHYWSLGFLCNWTGGTLRLYLNEFAEYFGDTPVRDIGLIASEGRMSIPMQDSTAAGVLDVVSNFYEFIPAEHDHDPQPECLLGHQLQVGREYFLVLTNSAGLYRYRIGDLVRVRGFEGQAPIIEFLSKGAHVSSMTGEKLTEHQVTTAVETVRATLPVDLKLFVLAATWDDPPYYKLHVECTAAVDKRVLKDFVTRVDQQLRAQNIEYEAKVKSLRLGPLRLNVLPDSFLERRDQALSVRYRQSNEQYKHQFLLSKPGEDADFPTVIQVCAKDQPAHPSESCVGG